jgi:hypothetical protein
MATCSRVAFVQCVPVENHQMDIFYSKILSQNVQYSVYSHVLWKRSGSRCSLISLSSILFLLFRTASIFFFNSSFSDFFVYVSASASSSFAENLRFYFFLFMSGVSYFSSIYLNLGYVRSGYALHVLDFGVDAVKQIASVLGRHFGPYTMLTSMDSWNVRPS